MHKRGIVPVLCAAFCSAQLVTRTEYVYRPVGQQGGGGTFSGVVPGMVLAAGSAALLWWNEGRTAAQERLLASANRKLVHASGTDALDQANDGRLVHLYSPTVFSTGVTDSLFEDVRRPKAARLRRLTEVYQWDETSSTHEVRISRDTVQRTTSYSYDARWRDHTVGNAFHDGGRHHNPTPRLVPSMVLTTATDARLANGVSIEPALLEQLESWHPVRLRPGAADEEEEAAEEASAAGEAAEEAAAEEEAVAEEEAPGHEVEGRVSSHSHSQVEGRVSSAVVSLSAIDGAAIAPLDGHSSQAECIYFPVRGFAGDAARSSGSWALADGPSMPLPRSVGAYLHRERRLSASPMARLRVAPRAQVGDARVRFDEVPWPSEGVSVLACQASPTTLAPWRDRLGGGGPSLYMLLPGRVPACEMLRAARAASVRSMWMLRGAGAALMWLGLGCSLSWLPALAARLPLLGGLAGSLAGAGIGIVSLGGALSLSAWVVALAWVRYRPWRSAVLVAMAASAYCALAKAAVALHAAQSLGLPNRQPTARLRGQQPF